MTNNNIFSSGYSTSNPFLNQQSTPEESLAQAYAKLEALKKQQYIPQQNNVFTDIAFEFKNLSQDEANFIINSPEYQSINAKYQSEFSQFLINKFSNEYLHTNNTTTLEEMLNIIRKQKENYQKKFTSDIDEIKGQNKTLVDKNNELVEVNRKLQEELAKIQERLNND